MNAGYTFKYQSSLQRMDRLLELFAAGPMTTNQAAAATHIHTFMARHYINELHQGESKRIYIFDWVRASKQGPWTALYALGNLPDKPHPPKKQQEKSEREYRKRRKADPDWHSQFLAKRRAAYRKRKPKRDALVAALFNRLSGITCGNEYD